MKIIDNGTITEPIGFLASGVASGLKKDNFLDLALLVSDKSAKISGVYTTNTIKGHSLNLTIKNAEDGFAKAVVINSGNANACIGKQGDIDALSIADHTAKLLNCPPSEIMIGSTGVIGIPLDTDKILNGLENAVESLSISGGKNAQKAILTTDLHEKGIAVSFEINNKEVRIGAMAKGSGMIHPNMATMISVITTDIDISKKLLDNALKNSVNKSFNRISVDGDTSVCDMVLILANGESNNPEISETDSEYEKFCEALDFVCSSLSKMIVKDGEGATKFIEIEVVGSASAEDAYKAACSVAKSPLVKTALFGEDANWGRIITAVGYSGAIFNPNSIDIELCGIWVCKNGSHINFNEEEMKQQLHKNEITVKINLNNGDFKDKMFTCDFSYDYIKINGSYRS